jgi:hypothetical protein
MKVAQAYRTDSCQNLLLTIVSAWYQAATDGDSVPLTVVQARAKRVSQAV